MAAPGSLPPRLSPSLARRVVGGARAVLFDCDGVLWAGERALPGAREVVEALGARGGPAAAIFVSNNSRRSRGGLGGRFRGLGFRGVREEQVYTSGHCAARHLARLLRGEGAKGGLRGSEEGLQGSEGLHGSEKGLQSTEGGIQGLPGNMKGLQGSEGTIEGLQGTHPSQRVGLQDQGQEEQGIGSAKQSPQEGTYQGGHRDQEVGLQGLHSTNKRAQRSSQDIPSTERRPEGPDLGPRQNRCDHRGELMAEEPQSEEQAIQGLGGELRLHPGEDPSAHGGHNLQDQQGEDAALSTVKDSRGSSIAQHDEHCVGEPQPGSPLVYLIGGDGLRQEMVDAELRVLGEEEPDAPVRAVLVGYDEEFTFRKLSRACTYLHDPNCLLVATDRDPWHLLSGGRCTPGTGSLVAAVETAAGRPATVVGKPSLFMFEDIMARHGLDPTRTLMVGDRLEVDIQFGRNCGLTSILTLTGVSQLADVQAYARSDCPTQRRLVPDYYIESIADLLPGLVGDEEM